MRQAPRNKRTPIALLVALACLAWLGPLEAGEQIDVNTASASELEQLPGIGPARASAIIEHRERHGPFSSVDSLTDVHGIGQGILRQIRDRITVDTPQAAAPRRQPGKAAREERPERDGGDFDLDLTRDDGATSFAERRRRPREGAETESEPTAPPEQRAPAASRGGPSGLINLNTADGEALTRLPGIGPARARAIVAHRRAEGPFRSVEQVTEVSGIGPATLNNIRELSTIELDLNGAGLEELVAIGIDMDAARQIIAWREKNGPFESVEQITEVPGFGRGALETLRPFLWVRGQ